MYFSVCVRRRDGHAQVTVDGDVDINSAPLLQQRLSHLLEEGESRLLVDLSGVTFIDCFGTRLLAQTCRQAEGRPCSVQFVALSEPVKRLAELTGLAGERHSASACPPVTSFPAARTECSTGIRG
jgi:anti-sigma B factor antagonist